MTSTLRFDAEASRQVEASYTTADVAEQRRVVLRALALRPGERALDVGAGPGLLAAEIAAAVGAEGLVCGIDISDSMLALARARTATQPRRAPIQLHRAGVERLPFAGGSFDVAVSTQVLEYVQDVPGALAEIERVLRPGGRVLLLDTERDSIVWHSGDDERMERVLGAWRQHLVDPHLPRTLGGSLERAGFEVAPPRIVPLFNTGFDRATYSARLLEARRQVRRRTRRPDRGGRRRVGDRPALAGRRLLLQPQPLPVPCDQAGLSSGPHQTRSRPWTRTFFRHEAHRWTSGRWSGDA